MASIVYLSVLLLMIAASTRPQPTGSRLPGKYVFGAAGCGCHTARSSPSTRAAQVRRAFGPFTPRNHPDPPPGSASGPMSNRHRHALGPRVRTGSASSGPSYTVFNAWPSRTEGRGRLPAFGAPGQPRDAGQEDLVPMFESVFLRPGWLPSRRSRPAQVGGDLGVARGST